MAFREISIFLTTTSFMGSGMGGGFGCGMGLGGGGFPAFGMGPCGYGCMGPHAMGMSMPGMGLGASFASDGHVLPAGTSMPKASRGRREYTKAEGKRPAKRERHYDSPEEAPEGELTLSEADRTGKREKKHDGKHEYSLAQYGLAADAIHRELEPLFERFGWDAAPSEKLAGTASDAESGAGSS